jgi:eukaryotic-like serine/threonine-protein kinase
MGGMASVHLARLVAEGGFARTVAIKRLLPQLAKDPDFSSMFMQEAQLAARIRHPNVVPTLDVVATDEELFLVMEYVHGESLSQLQRLASKAGEVMPRAVLSSILSSTLQGLHAAHEATNGYGEPLGLVHRDVSPQNVLVDVDGVTRVIDFGVAKAVSSGHSTRAGQVKGKIKYMAPEQVLGTVMTRRTDVFAAGIILWEGLTGRRLFEGDQEAAILHAVLHREIIPPSRHAADVGPQLDAVVMRALQRDPDKRFASAAEMSAALEAALPPASQRDVGDWVKRIAREGLAKRKTQLAEVESIVSLDSLAALSPGERLRAGESSASKSVSVLRSTSGVGSQSVMVPVSLPSSSHQAPAQHARPRSVVLPILLATLLGSALATGLFVVLERGNPQQGGASALAATPEGPGAPISPSGMAPPPSAVPVPASASVDAPAAPSSAAPSAATTPTASTAPATSTPSKSAPAKPAAPKPASTSKRPGTLYGRD